MSLHGYPENYGSVGYAQPSFSYPQHPSALDPNAFRQFYASQLASLTFNSRPIIQNLSMIAQDYNRLSNLVVQCIEAHIRRVSSIRAILSFFALFLAQGVVVADIECNQRNKSLYEIYF